MATTDAGAPSGVAGIHHVTAVSSDPQRTLDFYAGTLGLRFVKRTVNFDDPRTFHFYFADEVGTPGSVLTFFPWPGAARGRAGVGQVVRTTFAAPPGSLGFWEGRLAGAGVRVARQVGRVGEGASPGSTARDHRGRAILRFADFDGLGLAIVEAETSAGRPWRADPEVGDHALAGFHSATLWSGAPERTASVLGGILGFVPESGTEDERRFSSGFDGPGTAVDVRDEPGPRALGGAGTVHHVAFRAANEEHQTLLRTRLQEAGLAPTPVIDRTYFRSVYFREPGGILFEIATDGPGFAVDEPLDALGTSLRLPSRYEGLREEIERSLPAIRVPGSDRIPASVARGREARAEARPGEPASTPVAADSILTDWPHVWEPPAAGAGSDAPILLLLHGTGGDERDLLPLGRSLHPDAGRLSPRGRVVEAGMPRFFRRVRPGVFDLEDLSARAAELADFVEAAGRAYTFDPARVVAVGFSNGANIAVGLMLRRPELLRAALLLSPMLPYDPGPAPDLAGSAVFVGAGRQDPIAPASQVEALDAWLRAAGARVSVHWEPGGHAVSPSEVDAARRWLVDYIQGSSAVGP